MTYTYSAYGLGIHSMLQLPELTEAEGEAEPSADITICIGQIDFPTTEPNSNGTQLFATNEEMYMRWPNVGSYRVTGGQRIIIEPAQGAEERVVRLFALGPAFGILLHQRGHLVLHASAVRVGSEAVAFLGDQGWGKSTTAAAFYSHGHSVVSDDILAVQFNEHGATVFPGFPQLKLWPDVAGLLGDDIESLPRIRRELDKRTRDVADTFATDPLPLRSVYVLGNSTEHGETSIQSVPVREAFLELVRHSYVNWWLDATGTAVEHFHQCARLGGIVSLFRLNRQPSLFALHEIVSMVEEHQAHLQNTQSQSKES